MSDARHAAIVLAAGSSRRLGTPKQLLWAGGETLVGRAVRRALSSGPARCRVVVGHRSDEIARAASLPGVELVECPGWARGMGESLASGISGLPEDVAGVLVLTCDQVALDDAHVLALVAAWRADPSRAAASGYAGVAGVPAILPRAWWPEIVASCAGTDRGAREILRARASEIVVVEAPLLESDVDEPRDLR